MTKNLKLISLLLAVMMVVTLGVGCSGGGETQDAIEIGIIQYMDHIALDAAKEGFLDALKDNGYIDGENITVDKQNAQGDQSNMSSISDRFVSNNVDLVLAIATPAAQAIAGKTSEIPILATAITDFVSARLAESNESPAVMYRDHRYESHKRANRTVASTCTRSKNCRCSLYLK